MNLGRAQSCDEDLKEPKRKKVKPGTVLKDPYPIIFWNKLGIPPCNDLWPTYSGIFDGESVIIEYPEDISDIYSMGYFGKRILYRRGSEPNARDIPVLRERQWKRRVEWAAEFGYVLIPPEEAQGTSPGTGSQQGEFPDVAPARVKMENLDKESLISVCDETDPNLRNGEAVKDSKVCDQASTKDRNGDKSAETKKNTGEARNTEGYTSESLGNNCNATQKEQSVGDDSIGKHKYEDSGGEKGVGRSGNGSCLSDEGNSQFSGSEKVNAERTCKLKVEEGKDISIVEDSTCPDLVDDEKKETENGKDETEGVKVSTSESCHGNGDSVGQLMDGSTREAEVPEAPVKEISAEDVEVSAVEMESGGCKQSEENVSNCERADVELEVDDPVKGCKNGKEVSKSKKEEQFSVTRETDKVQITGGDDVAKDVMEVTESGEEEHIREVSDVDEEKNAKKESSDKSKDSVGNPSECSILGEGGREEEKSKEEVETVDADGSNRSNPDLAIGEIEPIPQADDIEKVDTAKTGKEEASSTAAEEIQVEGDVALRDDDNIESDGKARMTEMKVFARVEEESEERCERENIPDLNDSGKSVEIIEEGMKESSSPAACCSKVGKNLMEKVRKRSPNDSLGILEVNICEEGGTEEEREGDTDGSRNANKRMKMSEVVIVGVKDAVEKLDFDNVKNASKGRRSSDMGHLKGKGISIEDSQGMESEGNSKRRRSSLEKVDLNESTDCEIVEIEDERTSEHGRATSVNSFLKRKFLEENARCSDSDDDIMEVSVDEEEEEEEISEIKNGNKLQLTNKNGKAEAAMQSKETEKKSRCQQLLNEIRKKLPSCVEVMELGSIKLTAKVDSSKISNLKGGRKEAAEENEDDDVIEIDLQKSDMLELEDCVEESSMECENSAPSASFQRRLKRGSSSFVRAERGCDQIRDDEVKSEEVEEIDDKQSVVSQVKMESDCDISPCIVLPDSDTEDENSEAKGFPRLESDPSVYLPSLDVLRLLPEEAFFLAYGLGCLQVWDRRSMGTETPIYGDNFGGVVHSDESLGEGGRPVKTEESETRRDISEVVVIKEESQQKGQRDSESVTESSGGNSSSPLRFKRDHPVRMTDSSENSLLESIPVKCETERNSTSAGQKSKLASDQDEESLKKSADKIFDEGTSGSLQSASESSKDSLAKTLTFKSNEMVKAESDSCRKGLQKNDLSDSVKESESSGSSNPTPESKKQVDENLSKSSAFSGVNVSDVNKLDKPSDERETSQGKDISTNKDSDGKNKTDMNSSIVRENGELLDPITVIDLADSPPSRQWANKDGWSDSDDEDDVVTMDCHNPNVPHSNSWPPAGEMLNSAGETLNCDDDPMSLVDLWNAFRSSRSSTSPFATTFETSYAIYHHFRTKRWVVKPGVRFGGDFLLYKDGPSFYHASYLVIIDSSGHEEKSRLSWNTLAGMNRLAENVAKDLMICRVEWPQSITEEQLRSPKCLNGLTVQEILVRRWVSIKERDGEEEEFQQDKDDDFIPLQL